MREKTSQRSTKEEGRKQKQRRRFRRHEDYEEVGKENRSLDGFSIIIIPLFFIIHVSLLDPKGEKIKGNTKARRTRQGLQQEKKESMKGNTEEDGIDRIG
jgi:hypothetical protein